MAETRYDFPDDAQNNVSMSPSIITKKKYSGNFILLDYNSKKNPIAQATCTLDVMCGEKKSERDDVKKLTVSKFIITYYFSNTNTNNEGSDNYHER